MAPGINVLHQLQVGVVGRDEIFAQLVGAEPTQGFTVVVGIAHDGVNVELGIRSFTGVESDVMAPVLEPPAHIVGKGFQTTHIGFLDGVSKMGDNSNIHKSR